MRISRSMSDQHELEERVKTAQAECERLRKENVRLRAMLGVHESYVSRMISGTEPATQELRRLVAGLLEKPEAECFYDEARR